MAKTEKILYVDSETVDALLRSCVFDTDWEGLKKRLSKEFTIVELP